MRFTERSVTVMHAKVKSVCRYVRKLVMVRRIAASHKLEEMKHFRLPEKLSAWRRGCACSFYDVYDGQWQRWSQGHVGLGAYTKHTQIDVDYGCRRPPTPKRTTESMWADINVFK